jgi:hypothetical protein
MDHDWYARVPDFVEQDFVRAITPCDKRSPVSQGGEASHEPRRKRCFAGSADREIADRNDGNPALELGKDPEIITPIP